jgi:hypothetical protein
MLVNYLFINYGKQFIKLKFTVKFTYSWKVNVNQELTRDMMTL